MSALRTIFARLLGSLGSRKRDADLRAEIDAHLEEATEENIRRGLPAAEAHRLALAQFGGVTQTIEAHRERRRFRPFGSFGQDLVYGVRMLRRNLGFTLVAVLTLAVGILVNTTVFSAVNAVLFRPLAIERPAEVHQIFNGDERGGDMDDPFTAKHSYQAYKRLREARTMFDGLLATWTVTKPVNVPASEASSLSYAGRLRGEVVSGNYFTLLGVRALQGRLFNDDDDRTPNAHPVAVIGEAFWKNQLDADPNIVGRLIKLNGNPFNVIGIVPASFTGTNFGRVTAFWAPLMMQGQLGKQADWYNPGLRNYVMFCTPTDPSKPYRSMTGTLRPTDKAPTPAEMENWKIPGENCGPVRDWGTFGIFGRLPGGASREAAEAQLNAVAGHLAQASYSDEKPHFTLEPEVESRHKDHSSQVRLISLMALGGSILVWLVACGNVANLLLTRANARKRELAIRLSLGAGRWRVARQLLTESGLIALVGGGIAIALTFWTSQALSRVLPLGQIPGINLDFTPDLRVLGWALGLSLLTGLVFGTAPAWQSTRINLIPALKPGDSGSTSGARRLTLRNALVVGQLSLSVVVLVGAGLFIRSLQAARTSLGPGFSTERVVSMRFDLGSLQYSEARIDAFYRDLVTRARAIPGVEGASIINAPPFGEAVGNQSAWLTVEGAPETRESKLEVDTVIVGPRYFRTMGIPLFAGRDFEDSDNDKSGAVAIINQTEARRLFGDEQRALGKRVVLTRDGGTQLLQVVGITRDRFGEGTPTRTLTVPAYQRGSAWAMTLVLQAASAADVRAVADGARTLAQQLDPLAPMFDVRLAGDHDDPQLGAMRLTAEFSSALGLAALAMAMLGLYGVMAYAVTLRTREIGIRVALGAPAGDVRALVVRQGLALTGIGLAMGFLGAYLLAPVIDRLLISMPATDPVTFAGTALVLTATTLVACYLPARRATRVDPILTLRNE
ncbi:MAG TPA: ABC transporter permease [Vicinamibacterales bacterium]|nr:ABC transporter permease [Vicinamibacterales bacterium]